MINPLILHRLANRLHRMKIRKIPFIISSINYFLTHCDIGHQARIHKSVIFKHCGSGVVIHHRVKIDELTTIMPQVVIGQQLKHNTAVPLELISIGRNVMIGAGAKIIASGNFRIGNNVSIGANAVVLVSVPDDATAVGIPARVILP